MFPLPGLLSDSSSLLGKPAFPVNKSCAASVSAGRATEVVAVEVATDAGAPDNEASMAVEARARREDVSGGVGRVLVNVGALDNGVFAGVVTNEPPEKKALTDGLAMEKLARGWMLVIVGGFAALAGLGRIALASNGGADPAPAGKDCNRVGSIWLSVTLVAVGDAGAWWGGELLSFPSCPRGELWGSTSNELPKP